jgi:hypothetical protein
MSVSERSGAIDVGGWQLAWRWPGSRVERYAGGGHAFMAQEPARLAASIAALAGR